jgi:hypothetical protein
MASDKVLELVVFELAAGVSPEQFLGTADAVSDWISGQPGFVSRELSHDAEGDRWIEVVWWESVGAARQAAELAMSSPSCAPMFALIDTDSMLMLHGKLALAAAGAAA